VWGEGVGLSGRGEKGGGGLNDWVSSYGRGLIRGLKKGWPANRVPEREASRGGGKIKRVTRIRGGKTNEKGGKG